MDILLNTEQNIGFGCLNGWLSNEHSRIFTLIGWAGRGKTTLSVYWLSQLDKSIRARVAVTAPTNRAVDVFRSNWPSNLAAPGFMTIHSFLGIREVIQPDGTLKFLPQPKDEPKANFYDYLFVDESSMVGTELLKLILDLPERIKIIFCGDDRQLTPVGEKESPALNIFDSVRFQLLMPVRQKEGSPILEACEMFPNYWDIRDVNNESGSVNVLRNRDDFHDKIVDWAKDTRILEANYMKILAWRNKTTDGINLIIRKTIFGYDVPRFVEGDRIITKGPCLLEGDIMAYASEELVVDRVRIVKEEITPDIIWDTYQLNCTNSRNEKVWLRVIHEKYENQKQSLMSMVSVYAKQQITKGVPSKIAWANYYELKDMFHEVQHAYALTVHRAQGGTYENVAVHISDFNANRQLDERKRLFYTGCTRASQNLLLYYGST